MNERKNMLQIWMKIFGKINGGNRYGFLFLIIDQQELLFYKETSEVHNFKLHLTEDLS